MKEHAPQDQHTGSRFKMTDLARILAVSRSNVWHVVNEGSTVEWVVRTLAVLEHRGWPAATVTITCQPGVMVVTATATAPEPGGDAECSATG